jgi:hypothetical protein
LIGPKKVTSTVYSVILKEQGRPEGKIAQINIRTPVTAKTEMTIYHRPLDVACSIVYLDETSNYLIAQTLTVIAV